MKEFIDKLIERLEKEKIIAFKTYRAFDMNTDLGRMFGIEKSIEIINELAEEYKPKTQADKIRAMSDEELAEFFSERDKIPNRYKCKEIEDWIKWLQSEA